MREITFHAEHLKLMEMRPFERDKICPFLPLETLSSLGDLSRTLIHDGRILTCAGIIPMWEGVYEVWQIPSIYVLQYKIAYVKAMRALLHKYSEQFKIRRLQTHSPADDLHDAWMMFMGFECEGTLKAYNRHKDDYRIWRKEFVWE